MIRELGVCLAIAMCGGCSLILDFSSSAIPIDAEIDGPYTPDACAFLEPNDTLDTAMVVTATDTGPGAICAQPRDSGIGDDVDYYKFNVPAATTKVTVTLMYTNRPGGDLDLQLFDPAMPAMAIAKSRGFTDTETIVCPGASPFCPNLTPGNDYVFEVIPAIAGQVNQYTFSLTFQ
ncbi:MAG: hypothetical protein JWO36_3890 [Myxococcales bacterium]|nr:hypothetical protein [Myxococcales bacterium]